MDLRLVSLHREVQNYRRKGLTGSKREQGERWRRGQACRGRCSTLTSQRYKLGTGSAAEHLPSMREALGTISLLQNVNK